MVRLDSKPRGDAANHLKQVARRLFAERGVDGVTVREIAEAAGQKNHAVVGYYFGSKENLVRELVVDGARIIDERRNAMLDRLAAGGGPTSVADVVEALVLSSIGVAGTGPEDEDSYTRFIVMLGMTHRELFMGALENRWNSGYLRCLDHLRRLMPPMPAAAKNQRFVFIGAYLGAVLAIREGALTRPGGGHPAWREPQTMQHFIATVVAILEAPYDLAPPAEEGDAPRVTGPIGIVD